MAITQADWNAIWNNGFDAGYNKVHHTHHAVRPAPSAAELRIDAAAWNAVWNAGFQSAYGKHVAAPSPAGIATLAPGGAEAASAGGPAATVATVGRGGGGGGGAFGYDADQWQSIYEVVKAGYDLRASGKAIVACICLGNGENAFHSGGCGGLHGVYCGYFQLSPSLQSEHDYHDVAYWARRAYQDGFWGRGGLEALARRYPNESVGYLVNLCQGAYSNLTEGAYYYDTHDSGHGPGDQVANTLFNYWYPRVSGGARAPVSPGGQYTTVAPAHFSSPGGVTLEQVIRSENWAGDFEALWQHAQAGSDQAAGAAAAYLRNLQGHDYVTAH